MREEKVNLLQDLKQTGIWGYVCLEAHSSIVQQFLTRSE